MCAEPAAPEPVRRPTAPFAALRHRDFRRFWYGACVSFVGSWVQTVALGLYVYETTGSKQALGVIGLASGLPTTALLLFGGFVADRVDKRRLLLVTQSIFALCAFVLAYLTGAGHIAMWQIIALSFVNGTVFALDGPARQALIYDLVGPEDLATGVALQSAAFNIARVIGPAVAGIAYVSIGPAWCFFINGVSFAAMLAGIAAIRPTTPAKRAHEGSTLQGMLGGLTYLRSSPMAQAVLALTSLTSILAFSNYSTLMPAIAKDLLHIGEADRRYGLLFTAIGVGALCAVYVVGRQAAIGRRGVMMAAGPTAFGLALVLLSMTHSFAPAFGLFALIGLAAVGQLATANTLTQTLAPPGLSGRAVSLHMFAMAGLQPFGAYLAGSIAQRFGVSAALLMGGLGLWISAAICLMARPAMLRLR